MNNKRVKGLQNTDRHRTWLLFVELLKFISSVRFSILFKSFPKFYFLTLLVLIPLQLTRNAVSHAASGLDVIQCLTMKTKLLFHFGMVVK